MKTGTSTVRVYVDFDDVLCETARRLADLCEELFGHRVDFESIHSFDLASSFGLTPEEHDVLLDTAHRDEFLLSIAPVAGAADVLRRWAQDGLRICIVTGRPAASADASREWLRSEAIPVDELITVDKYGRHDREGADRDSVALEDIVKQDFCLAVEDEPNTARYLADHLGAPVMLLRRPWNAGAAEAARQTGGRLIPCADWNEVGRVWDMRRAASAR